jgi:hypothetical protein
MLIFFYPVVLLGQFSNNNYSLAFKAGYFYPTKTSFQDFYDQSLYDIPISSLGVELDYKYSEDITIFIETKIIHNTLVDYDDRTLDIIPTFVGFKYIYENSKNSNFFAGIGAGFYWILLRFEQIYITNNSTIFEEYDVFYRSYYGVGIKPFIGFDFKVSRFSRFGFQFDYDISYLGSVEKGGMGNTGGLLTNIFFNFDL